MDSVKICNVIPWYCLSFALVAISLLAFCAPGPSYAQSPDSSVVVTVVPDESDAVLSILSRRQSNLAITAASAPEVTE